MKYMVVETFAPGRKALVYARFQQKGRMLPEGLYYIDGWPEKDGDRCFQLMEAGSPHLFETWISNWKDLVSFEVIELEPQKPRRRSTLKKTSAATKANHKEAK